MKTTLIALVCTWPLFGCGGAIVAADVADAQESDAGHETDVGALDSSRESEAASGFTDAAALSDATLVGDVTSGRDASMSGPDSGPDALEDAPDNDASSSDEPCISEGLDACAGKQCGTVAGNCFPIACGSCSGQDQCIDNQCVCVPNASNCIGRTCGDVSDGCGGMISCGTCPMGDD